MFGDWPIRYHMLHMYFPVSLHRSALHYNSEKSCAWIGLIKDIINLTSPHIKQCSHHVTYQCLKLLHQSPYLIKLPRLISLYCDYHIIHRTAYAVMNEHCTCILCKFRYLSSKKFRGETRTVSLYTSRICKTVFRMFHYRCLVGYQ